MPWLSFLAIGGGAAVGAWCRWGLSVWLNPQTPLLPLGTLLANLAGGLLIGLMIATIERIGGVSPELRLLIITGFLGALTTFSSFSAEVVIALQRGSLLWAGATVLVHVVGSLLCTGLGIALVFWLARG